MRLGIFGGSFDPVHNGHLQLAAACRDQAQLDQVWFMPTAQQPFKPHGPHASVEDRCAMLRLVLNQPWLGLTEVEIQRGGVSYTVGSLRELTQTHPQDDFFLLLGADSMAELPTWREPKEICQLAIPVGVTRTGTGFDTEIDINAFSEIVSPERLQEIREHQVVMRPVDISSTEIRYKVAADQSIDQFVPPAVAEYIQEHRLYR